MSIEDNLRAARKLIENEEDWCQGAWSKTTDGHIVRCAAGALEAVTVHMGMGRLQDYIIAKNLLLRGVPFGGSLTIFNDHHTHNEVLGLFDRTIELAHKQGV